MCGAGYRKSVLQPVSHPPLSLSCQGGISQTSSFESKAPGLPGVTIPNALAAVDYGSHFPRLTEGAKLI